MIISALRLLLPTLALLLSAPLFAQGGAVLTITPVLLDYGVVFVGDAPSRVVTLSNVTDATLEVTNFTQTGDAAFTVNPNAGSLPCGEPTPVIAAQDSCTMEVIFAPDFPDDFTGSVTFTPNGDPTKAISLRLEGSTPQDNEGGCSLGGAGSASAWMGLLLALSLAGLRRLRS